MQIMSEKERATRLAGVKLLSIATLFFAFFGVVLWFRNFDFYHQHFFDTGAIVAAYNLLRIVFVFLLCWLVYAPGAAITALITSEHDCAALSRVERAVLGFGIGVALWHVAMLILGIIGLYYWSVMVVLCLLVLIASARHFGRVAADALQSAAGQLSLLRRGVQIPQTIGAVAIAIAAFWLLLLRGLYPNGTFDYYLHYFPYYLAVLKNHGLAPNVVWYHYWYSKGYGLFFLGMILTDPEASGLVTFCYVLFAALAIAALINRIAPRSLWPACGALIYLLYNLISISHTQGGEFQKDHEAVTALVVLGVWGICMARGGLARPCMVMTASSGIAAVIIAQPAVIIFGPYLGLLAGCAALRRQWGDARRYCLAGAAISSVALAIFVLNYLATGLISDRALDLTLRFADFTRLDHWGALPYIVFLARFSDMDVAMAPRFGWYSLTQLGYFVRFDLLRVFLAGPALAFALVAIHALQACSIGNKTAAAQSPLIFRTIACLGSLLGLLVVVSVVAGRVESYSYERFSSFFVPLIVLLGIALCNLAMLRPLGLGYSRLLRLALPIVLIIATLASWQQMTNWASRVMVGTANGLRFLGGDYSFAEAYTRQDIGPPFGGIDPEALAAWRHVEPGAKIWGTTNTFYCMVPGCMIETFLNFKIPRILDIMTGSPEQAKQLFQNAGVNYFLVVKDRKIGVLASYSRLFAPETIGRYLAVKWTDGSAFLLTWIGPHTTPIGSEFLDIYKELQPVPDPAQPPWYELVPQIPAIIDRLRSTPWGTAPDFPWSHPPLNPPGP
jgi:hypothetical protein